MKKLIVVLMVVGLVGMVVGTAKAATDSANINLLITPVVTVDLSVSPTYYDFGSVDVQVSTCSILALTLSNDGTVGVTLDKTVWNDGGDWDITVSSTVQDGFDLWAMTQNAQPGQGDYTDNNDRFVKTEGNGGYNVLYNRDEASQEDLDSEETKNLWFRLDMPKYTTNVNEKTINVRIRATNK